MKHTVGPWKAHARDYHSYHNGNFALISAGLSIAIVYHAGTEEDQANANLIAAAPTLLDALRAVVGSANPNAFEHPKMTTAWEIAREAIAKAEGRA